MVRPCSNHLPRGEWNWGEWFRREGTSDERDNLGHLPHWLVTRLRAPGTKPRNTPRPLYLSMLRAHAPCLSVWGRHDTKDREPGPHRFIGSCSSFRASLPTLPINSTAFSSAHTRKKRPKPRNPPGRISDNSVSSLTRRQRYRRRHHLWTFAGDMLSLWRSHLSPKSSTTARSRHPPKLLPRQARSTWPTPPPSSSSSPPCTTSSPGGGRRSAPGPLSTWSPPRRWLPSPASSAPSCGSLASTLCSRWSSAHPPMCGPRMRMRRPRKSSSRTIPENHRACRLLRTAFQSRRCPWSRRPLTRSRRRKW